MKDAVLLPIDVDFSREIEAEEEAGEPGVKRVRRTLFSRMNPYPQKKIMAYTLTSVLVKGVKGALDGNVGDNIETKGVKAHFQLDDSGILTCTHVESVFEKI